MIASFLLLLIPLCHGADEEQLTVRISRAVKVRGEAGVTISGDGPVFVIRYPRKTEGRLQNVHTLWADLIAAGDADSARRMGNDAAMDPGSPRLFIETSEDGTRGFAVTVAQLKRERAMWVPAMDLYIAAGEPFVDFSRHMESLKAWQGLRILDRVSKEPEASYEQFTALWEDMGNPAYVHPRAAGPGHVICLAWDSSLYKFGIDRGAGVRQDYGNPDKFKLWFDFGDITQGFGKTWRKQSLDNGLPIVTTVFEKDLVRYEVEQFAYPLDGPPNTRRGDIPMVLLERLRVSSLDGKTHRVPVTLVHQRVFAQGVKPEFAIERRDRRLVAGERGSGLTVLEVDGVDSDPVWSGVRDYGKNPTPRLNLTFSLDVPASGFRDVVVKLPSPMPGADGAARLAAIDYQGARAATVRFWSGWLDKGAMFRVPEKVVNDLFRANVWHALRLPRRHGGEGTVPIDLPYSNFAYGQKGTPWPVNQALYVDYMLYGLRGYFDVANEEIEAQYRNNQEPDGHIGGYANWLIYTPGMLYATAQNYLLSGDRRALDRVMPQNLKALAWCLEQVRAGDSRTGSTQGLITGHLNDLTGKGIWARNQGYMYAGLELFGRVLEEIGDPRGTEARAAAARLAAASDRAFRIASANSPLVQLRDHTWSPYVPTEAGTFRRRLDLWYPTDVDAGPVHMLRLKLVPATSDLADWLLNDHEDNVYYKGWGMSNEPIYLQQASAYLLRDDAPAVIRAFYSNMASAFSHSTLEPVEHRWTHGQFFGPPSTDGSWFELYRNMLIQERDDESLLLTGFTPRRWMEDGKRIEVQRAPTRFGQMSMTIESHAKVSGISADIEMPDRKRPGTLLVRLRHPSGTRLRAVRVNGKAWTDFDPAKEWVRIATPTATRYSILASY